MTLYTYEDLTVRRLTPEDAPLLVQWLSDLRVLAYYEGRDRPHDAELVRRKYYGREQEHSPCIVEYQGRSIGYIQYYPVEGEEKRVYGYGDDAGTIYGMDQFIGEPDYWSRGIGTKLVASMVRYLTEQIGANKVVMDPQTWNVRALRVYEKCGFVKKKLLSLHEWHEGEYRDCWLMEYAGDKQERS